MVRTAVGVTIQNREKMMKSFFFQRWRGARVEQQHGAQATAPAHVFGGQLSGGLGADQRVCAFSSGQSDHVDGAGHASMAGTLAIAGAGR
jgi:hypothetical protein